MSWIDIAVIGVCFVGVTAFGCSFYFKKGSNVAESFVVGEGRIPGWVLALFFEPKRKT